MSKHRVFWGVKCRECSEAIAFGAPTQADFGVASECARPGAIRCSHGHTSIYFPRDFEFFVPAEEISDDVMRANREIHSIVNPIVTMPTDQLDGQRWTPAEVGDTGISLSVLRVAGVSSATAPDGDLHPELAEGHGRNWWPHWPHWAFKRAS
jgi:hypothetical protein